MLQEIIKIGSASFIASRVFKYMGKKEYSELIMLCGLVGVGIAFFSGLNGIADGIEKSKLMNFVKWLISLGSK